MPISRQLRTYPSPNSTLTPTYLLIITCWVRGGVGAQLPRYWHWSKKLDPNIFTHLRKAIFLHKTLMKPDRFTFLHNLYRSYLKGHIIQSAENGLWNSGIGEGIELAAAYLLKSNSMRFVSPHRLIGTICKLLSFNWSVSSVGENREEGSSQSVLTFWASSWLEILKNGNRFGDPAW